MQTSAAAAQRTMAAADAVLESQSRVLVHRSGKIRGRGGPSTRSQTHAHSRRRPPAAELGFVQLAAALARNVTSLRKRSARLSLRLQELRQRVGEQLEQLLRAEVKNDGRREKDGGVPPGDL